MSTPLVTVGIPTRNRADVVGRALQSVLDQTLADIEIFVLDDESTDDTAEVVGRLADHRVTYLRNVPRLGMAGNWNAVLHTGSAPHVAILHDDDYWHPRFLERAHAMFEAHPDLGLVYAASVPVDPGGNVVRGPRLSLPSETVYLPADVAVERVVRATEVAWPAILMRREAVVSAGGFNEEFPYHKDWQLWIRVAATHPIGFVAEELGFYGTHPGQFSAEFTDKPLAKARERHTMLQTTIAGLPLPPERRRQLTETAMRALAETQLVTAWDLAAAGLGRAARREAAYTFQIDPAVARRAPHLLVAACAASFLPSAAVRLLDRLRRSARPLFRRA